jgi:hypothetical protein
LIVVTDRLVRPRRDRVWDGLFGRSTLAWPTVAAPKPVSEAA